MTNPENMTVKQDDKNVNKVAENEETSNGEKKPKKRRTKQEQIKDIEKQKEKLLLKLDQLTVKQQRLSLTTAEKKEEKRKAENNCKIIAGITAFELYRKGKVFFTIEMFRSRLYSQLTHPLEIDFLNKQLK